MRFPAFLLRKLFVPGSLAHAPEGFSFLVRNSLATATIVSFPHVHVDGLPVDPARLRLEIAGRPMSADDVGAAKPLDLAKGAEVRFVVSGRLLGPGAHKIRVRFETREWQALEFEVESPVANP